MSPMAPARRAARLAVFAAAALAAAGCQGNSTRVTGRVLLNGQPYALEPGERLELTFYLDGGGKGRPPLAIPADVKPDGTFAPNFGAEGNSITPGSYKIGVASGVYELGYSEPRKRKYEREFSQEKTPLSFEAVAGEKVDLVVDLTAKTVTVTK